MMNFLLAAALLAVGLGDLSLDLTKKTPTLSSCGTDDDIMTDFAIFVSPDPPRGGRKATFTMTGTLTKPLAGGTMAADMSVSVMGLSIPITGGADFTMIQPTPAGEVSMVFGPFTFPRMPIGFQPKITGKMTLTDPEGRPIMCIQFTKLPMHGEPILGDRLHDDPTDPPSPMSDCGSSSDHFQNLQFDMVGNTVYLNGTFDEVIDAGTFDMDMTINLHILEEVVEKLGLKSPEIKINFSISSPLTMTPGFQEGLNGLVLTIDVPPTPPTTARLFGPGVDVTGKFKASDSKDEEIFCYKVDISTTPSEEH